jgi:hypothetical protein
MSALPDSIPARGAAASASRPPRIGQLLQQLFTAMTARERARLIAMYGVIAGRRAQPGHYRRGGYGIGGRHGGRERQRKKPLLSHRPLPRPA